LIGEVFRLVLPWGDDEAEYEVTVTDIDKGFGGSYWEPPEPACVVFDMKDPDGKEVEPADDNLWRKAEELLWEEIEERAEQRANPDY
jgi:hypothetical protein